MLRGGVIQRKAIGTLLQEGSFEALEELGWRYLAKITNVDDSLAQIGICKLLSRYEILTNRGMFRAVVPFFLCCSGV